MVLPVLPKYGYTPGLSLAVTVWPCCIQNGLKLSMKEYVLSLFLCSFHFFVSFWSFRNYKLGLGKKKGEKVPREFACFKEIRMLLQKVFHLLRKSFFLLNLFNVSSSYCKLQLHRISQTSSRNQGAKLRSTTCWKKVSFLYFWYL